VATSSTCVTLKAFISYLRLAGAMSDAVDPRRRPDIGCLDQRLLSYDRTRNYSRPILRLGDLQRRFAALVPAAITRRGGPTCCTATIVRCIQGPSLLRLGIGKVHH